MKSCPSPATRRPRSRLAIWLLLAAVALSSNGCERAHRRTRPSTSLSAPDREMLAQYESIRAELAQDDARSAKRTAANYLKGAQTGSAAIAGNSIATDAAAKIASAIGIEPQREAFRTWSTYVISLTKEVEGFYVIHCPVPGCGDWLQTSPKVDNPFMGKSMHDCGEVEK